uniref:Uncharacterized protein n=1 Tax=Myoviridae sp. ctk251 TaxID=2826689 RepID=A0A8S5MT90_9CAUD|nr:MAG TPA: hypothetical protein [Myoviridae sp. ctk251]
MNQLSNITLWITWGYALLLINHLSIFIVYSLYRC